MSDNISRSALIKQIEIDSDGSPGWYGDTWQFMKTIAKMPSTDNWIPCSERLPEHDGDVIMTNTKGQVKVGYHSEGRWWFIKDDGYMTGVNDDANIIIAWMPLPEPYKGGEDE